MVKRRKSENKRKGEIVIVMYLWYMYQREWHKHPDLELLPKTTKLQKKGCAKTFSRPFLTRPFFLIEDD